jgi:hypothetical protein
MAKKILLLMTVTFGVAISQWNAEGTVVADSNVRVSQFYPYTITDGRGGSYIVWGDFRNNSDINMYVQRLDSSGREVFQHNGIPIVTALGTQTPNQCISDGKGGIFFTWSDHRGSDSYIYAQHMDSGGNMLWQTNGIKVSEAHGLGAQVVLDGVGGIIISYAQYTSNYSGVVVQHINSGGNRMWGDSGISQSNNGMFVTYLQSASDSQGGIILSWTQEKDTDTRIAGIYAQRIRHDGSIAWQQNGIGLSTVDTVRSTVRVLGYTEAGAIICWGTGTNVEVRAQRIDSTGLLLWGNNGVHVGYGGIGTGDIIGDQKKGAIISVYPRLYRIRSDGSQVWPGGVNFTNSVSQMCLVSDSVSGVIVAFSRRYDASPFDDMFAQRIDSNGIVRWKSDGVPMANYYSDKFFPRAVSDGKGGVIAAWLDARPNGGVYAGKVDSQGNVITSVPFSSQIAPPMEIALFQNFPNPFNPETVIRYQISVVSHIKLTVFDLLGREIAILVNERKEPGEHSVRFVGQNFPSGIYFYQLIAGTQTITKKMVIIH